MLYEKWDIMELEDDFQRQNLLVVLIVVSVVKSKAP